MNNDELLEKHANEFKKFDYDVLLAIAKSGDQLTYTFEDENGLHQIELFFDAYSEEKLDMVLAIDSNWNARFDKKTKAKVFEIFAGNQKMKDTKFSIALPNGKDEKNVAKLIRWALKELPSDKVVQIDQFLLEHPYTSDGKPTISVDYDLLDENMINLRNQNTKYATLVDGNVPEVEYAFDPYEKTPLNCLTRRMPAGMQQDDSVSLLRTVARDIEQLGNVEILDLIYHDFLDDNIVSRPYVNVYFRRQPT